jgi:CubicO group peptidase (beta-lactamase class C family)
MRLASCLLLAAAVATALPSAARAQTEGIPADTAAFIQSAIDNGDYVGVVIALVNGDDVTIKGFGLADKATGKVADAGTVFEIGSITKTFTGTLLAGEVLSDKMRLDDPVQNYLPQGVTMPQVGDRPMTLLDIATHRSGLPRLPADFASPDPADPYAGLDEAWLWMEIGNLKLTRPPGAQFEYSNFGFGLLGDLIARREGQSYPALVRNRIFEPLGMTHSSVGMGSDLRPWLAQGYDGSGNPVAHWSFSNSAVHGLGAIYSSARDMTRFLRTAMAVAGKTAKSSPLADAMALAMLPRAEAMAGRTRIGLAWMSSATGANFMHDGGTYGFSSFIGGDAKHGVVVLANTLQTQLTTGMALHLLNPALPLPKLTRRAHLSDAQLARYAGSYVASPQMKVDIAQADGGLSVSIAGQPAQIVLPSAPDHFFYSGLPATIDFDRNAQSQVARLTFHQNGMRLRVPRIGVNGQPVAQPARITLSPAQLDAYAGRYQLTPQLVLTVARDGDHLTAQVTGQPQASAIFTERPDHFEYELIDADLDFTRDTVGKVISVAATLPQGRVSGPKIREGKVG